MEQKKINVSPKILPVLDEGFIPASLYNRNFLAEVEKSGKAVNLAIALERSDGLTSTYNTKVFADDCGMDEVNCFYAERLVKAMLWLRGGFKVTIGGSNVIGNFIKEAYAPGGLRQFDAGFMSRVYERPFTVDVVKYENVPAAKESSKPAGRHLDGCRIGFDAGGSDRKVSAVVNGEAVYSEEVVWHPKTQTDPEYHFQGILESMKTAASHMPRVDAIGVSSAGIYVNNRTMAASLFIKVPEPLFNDRVKNIYIDVAKEIGNIPLEVANDGDVTALAGAMDLDDGSVLGIAMGTSEAGGYVDPSGNITGWLNELAFVPVDYNRDSMIDEWSGDYGCGVKYFSQDSVIKLAGKCGLEFAENSTPAEKLKFVQELHEKGNENAEKIFESIGCYLGYALAHYADFYEIKHVLILGRVTSGEGGNIIMEKARQVLDAEFPQLAAKMSLRLPDESNRRVGQSIAAASLPVINR